MSEERERQEENNKEYAENYARGRSGDCLRDAMNSIENHDSIEYKAYMAGQHDRSEHGYKSAENCGSGETKDSGRVCFITTACVRSAGLPDDCHELKTLRHFRDEYVASLPCGPALIAEYYATAPAVVKAIDLRPDGQQVYSRILLDIIRPCIRLIEDGKRASALVLYRETFANLRSTLLPA